MNRTNLETKKVELHQQMSQVVEVLRQAQLSFEVAKKDLTELNEKTLPKSLVDAALGRMSKAELQRIKRKISDLKEVISDFPSLMSGLESEKARIGVFITNLAWSEKHLTKYETLKAELEEKGFQASLAESLLGLSRELGLRTETENFLAELKAKNG